VQAVVRETEKRRQAVGDDAMDLVRPHAASRVSSAN